LGLLVESGLTPAEALTTGTANAARFLDQESEFGFIREGLAADLVLLRANPLEDVDNAREPAGVMLRGRWLSRAELDQGLEQIAARYAP
jgi:imidazolonepropionase-like amidohydrolase